MRRKDFDVFLYNVLFHFLLFFFFIFFLILTKHYKTKEKMECDRKRSMTEKPDHIGPIIGIESKYSVSMLWMSQKMGG